MKTISVELFGFITNAIVISGTQCPDIFLCYTPGRLFSALHKDNGKWEFQDIIAGAQIPEFDNLLTATTVNSCGELIQLLTDNGITGEILFQGDKCHVISSCDIPLDVTGDPIYTGKLTIYESPCKIVASNGTVAVCLPMYVKEELLAILNGKW